MWDVLSLMELTNVSAVRELMGDLLSDPFDFRPLLQQTSDCAEANAPLRAYACAALSDTSLMTHLRGAPPAAGDGAWQDRGPGVGERSPMLPMLLPLEP